MWNSEKSIILSKLCVLFFMGLLLAAAVTAPWLTRWIVEFSQAGLKEEEAAYFMGTIYVRFVPAVLLL